MFDDPLKIQLYAVRDKDGLYFTKSRSYEDSWVKDFKKARIYTRIGDARRVITTFMVEDDIPDVIVLDIVGSRVVDDRERQEIRIDKKDKDNKRSRVDNAKKKLEEADKEYKKSLKEAVE